nr:hypothetical protein [Tanacetum cinerariifolium]
DEETTEKEEESFDPIPRTPEESKDDGNDEEDQGLRTSEEERMQEEEEADELYRDVWSPYLRLVHLPVKLLKVNFSNIPGIANQYMHQQMPEAIREAVQTQTDRLQDSIQRENDEFLKTIDDNMKKIIKEQMEGNKSIQQSDEQRNLYKALVEAYDADKTILDTYRESAILKKRREDDDQEGPSAGSDRGSTTGTQSRQLSASESAFVEEPVQTTDIC